MAACCGCNPRRTAGWRQRLTTGLRWLVPCCILALMPKCPLCVAGYFAVATGIGLSTATAGIARTTLISLSVLMLVMLAIRAVARLASRQQQLP